MSVTFDRKIFRRVIGQSAVFMGIGIVAGILTLDRARLPSIDASASEKGIRTLSLEQAREKMAGGNALCIDVRSVSEFGRGHIRGAISMPLEDMDRELARHLDLFSQDKPIVVYCGGEGCDLSRFLARKLIGAGMDQIFVFGAGWEGWRAAGLPIDP
jgi:rhodanese-related sulfurtransferase